MSLPIQALTLKQLYAMHGTQLGKQCSSFSQQISKQTKLTPNLKSSTPREGQVPRVARGLELVHSVEASGGVVEGLASRQKVGRLHGGGEATTKHVQVGLWGKQDIQQLKCLPVARLIILRSCTYILPNP